MSSNEVIEHRLKILEEAIVKLTHVQEDLAEIQLSLARSEVRDAQNADLLIDLEKRVRTLEVAAPAHDQAAKWVGHAMWAAASAAALLIWQKVTGGIK